MSRSFKSLSVETTVPSCILEQPDVESHQVAAWCGFIAMCVGMFMAILDIQIVATSLPAIQGALGIQPDQMSWIQTSYLIAEVISIPLTGFMTRLLSLRGLFTLAVTVFILASAGCAAASGFSTLILWRTIQGFAGGTLIPAVFSSVFLLFPARGQALATTIAGVLAVLAPTVGPIGGGWITSTYSWHWLFLVNIMPGLAATIVAYLSLPRTSASPKYIRHLDILSLILLAEALASLEIGLKEAPTYGWASGSVTGLLLLAGSSGAAFFWRTLSRKYPLVDLTAFADRNFALGSALSFILGIGLYGSVYLMPVFLAYVRGHGALEIGEIMLVTGAAQLASAPIAVWLEKRMSPSLLSALGFALFSVGMAMSFHDTPRTDFAEMFWPQALRGFSIMFCLLPPTRVALGHLPPERIPDASGLFNLMRNLGGAVGLAVIDTIVFGHIDSAGRALVERLMRGDGDAFAFVGLPPLPSGTTPTIEMLMSARPAIEKAALTITITQAWALVAALTALGVILSLLVRRQNSAERAIGERLN